MEEIDYLALDKFLNLSTIRGGSTGRWLPLETLVNIKTAAMRWKERKTVNPLTLAVLILIASLTPITASAEEVNYTPEDQFIDDGPSVDEACLRECWDLYKRNSRHCQCWSVRECEEDLGCDGHRGPTDKCRRALDRCKRDADQEYRECLTRCEEDCPVWWPPCWFLHEQPAI